MHAADDERRYFDINGKLAWTTPECPPVPSGWHAARKWRGTFAAVIEYRQVVSNALGVHHHYRDDAVASRAAVHVLSIQSRRLDVDACPTSATQCVSALIAAPGAPALA